MNFTNINAKATNYVFRSAINDNFVKDIARIPIITAEEEIKCFKEIKESRDRVESAKNTADYNHVKEREEKIQLALRNKIITGNLRINYATAKRYDNNDIVLELVNEGIEGMIEAFKDYDINKGVRFSTYAMYYIKRAMNAFITKENVVIRSSNDAKILPKVKKIENEFYCKNGYMPSAEYIKEELFDRYGIDNVNSLDLVSAELTSIDAPVSSDDDNYTLSMDDMYNSKTAYTNDYMEDVEMESKRHFINQMFSTLDKREVIIVSMAMGYNYDKEYKDCEISEELGLTSERVRQIRLGALKKLQKFATVGY